MALTEWGLLSFDAVLSIFFASLSSSSVRVSFLEREDGAVLLVSVKYIIIFVVMSSIFIEFLQGVYPVCASHGGIDGGVLQNLTPLNFLMSNIDRNLC